MTGILKCPDISSRLVIQRLHNSNKVFLERKTSEPVLKMTETGCDEHTVPDKTNHFLQFFLNQYGEFYSSQTSKHFFVLVSLRGGKTSVQMVTESQLFFVTTAYCHTPDLFMLKKC